MSLGHKVEHKVENERGLITPSLYPEGGNMPIIKLDRERNAHLTLNVMEQFEEQTGKSMFKTVYVGDLSIHELKLLLWLSLHDDDPDLELEQLGSLVDVDNLLEVCTTLLGANKIESISPLGNGGPGQS